MHEQTQVAPDNSEVRLETLFCKRFGCQPSEYGRRAFWKLLYSHAKLPAIFLGFSPRFFAEDLKFIRHLGDSADIREAHACAAEFQDRNAWTKSFLRKRFKVRVSGLKASELAEQLFSAVP